MCDLNTAALGGTVISVAPLRIEELRAINNDLIELDTGASLNFTRDDVDACAQTEYEGRVLSVQGEIAAGKEDLARS